MRLIDFKFIFNRHDYDNTYNRFYHGYIGIVFEHSIKLNKGASALITSVLCWTIYNSKPLIRAGQ